MADRLPHLRAETNVVHSRQDSDASAAGQEVTPGSQWPPGDSEMARLIRTHAWSATPLGPIATWPQSLRFATRMLLTSRHPMFVWWGPEQVQLYNDAYRDTMGPEKHPSALGRSGRETWAEIWDTIGPQIAHVMAGGPATWHEDQLVPVTRHGGRQDVWWTYSFSPIEDDGVAGGIGGVLVICRDVTETHLAREAALRNAARQSILLELSDALRPLADPAKLQAAAMRLLADHLDVTRATYFEVDADQDRFTMTAGHERGLAPIPERMRLSDLASGLAEACRTGRTLAVRDTEREVELEGQRAAYRAIGVRAWAAVPLVRSGRLLAIVGVHSTTPRDWTVAELHILEDVAERSWAAVERVRAEAATRDSDARYQTLFQSIDAGYCVVEVIFDAAGRAVDYLFLEINPAFERQSGLARAVGRTARAFMPDLEPFWFETYGRIARTGEPERVEHLAEPMGRWFRVNAFRIDAPEQHRVAILFEDVTERKHRELGTAFLDEVGTDLARLSSPDEIMQTVGAKLGAFLRVSGCHFCDVDEERDEVTIHHGWHAEQVPSLRQTYRLKDYLTEEFSRASRAGENVVVRDTAHDERTDADNYARLAIGAFVSIPFSWNGRWTAYLAVTDVGPRDWRDDEVKLLVQVSDRLFSRVERARAEAALRDSGERLRQFGDASSDVLWIRDAAKLQWEYLTPAFEAIYGLAREEALAGDTMSNWLDLILPEDRERAAANIERVRNGEEVTFEYRVRRPKDGQVRWLRNTDFPMRDRAGRVVRIGGVGHDATGLKEAEEAVAASEARLRTLAEGIPHLLWRSDNEGWWTWASPQWSVFTGQPEAASHGRGWLDVIHPGDRDHATRAWHAAQPHGVLDVEYRVRRAADGAWIWHHTRSVPVCDATGRIVEWLGTSTDVQQLKELQERQHVMVAELQHRTRNLITVVRSIAEETLRASDGMAYFRERFGDRLAALSRVQGLLSQSDEAPVTLDSLLRLEFDALGADAVADRLVLEGPAVRLRKSTVQTLALALHELATNARKYGALAVRGGRLAVTWRVETGRESGPRLRLDWVEDTPRQSEDAGTRPPRAGGYGRKLIEQALPYALDAETRYVLDDRGVRCAIELPLAHATIVEGDEDHG